MKQDSIYPSVILGCTKENMRITITFFKIQIEKIPTTTEAYTFLADRGGAKGAPQACFVEETLEMNH